MWSSRPDISGLQSFYFLGIFLAFSKLPKITPRVFDTIQGLNNNDGLLFPSFQAPACHTTYSNNLWLYFRHKFLIQQGVLLW
jgi:hypothetical protein